MSTEGSWIMRYLHGWLAVLAALLALGAVAPAASAKGPIILAGIDAEDGGVNGHGPIENYATMAQSILASVNNGGKGILVFGGGSGTAVEEFWSMIGARTGQPVTFATGDAARTAPLAGVAMVGVASSVHGTSSGGLTDAENAALAARKDELVAFINGGGGLLGFSQSGFAEPYAYVGFGGVKVDINLEYSDITPESYGPFSGVTDALDVCCWHDTYTSYPGFMQVLGVDTRTSDAAVIGGLSITIDQRCSASLASRPSHCALSAEEQYQVLKEHAVQQTPQESALALVACEAAAGRGIKGRRKRLVRAGARVLCDSLLGTAYTLAQTGAPFPDTARVAELPEPPKARAAKVTRRQAGCGRSDGACKAAAAAFERYARDTAAMMALLQARAIAANRLEAAKTSGRPDAASLQLGAVKSFSSALSSVAKRRAKSARKLAGRLKKARAGSRVSKSRVRRAGTRLARPRGRGQKVALRLASSGLLANTSLAPLLANRALGTIPATKGLDLAKLLRRPSAARVYERLGRHVRIAEVRRMLDAVAARNQVSAQVKPGLVADLDKAACAANAQVRAQAMRDFVAKSRSGIRGRSRGTLAEAARRLIRYRPGISDPLGECRQPPPLLPPPPPPPTLSVTPSFGSKKVGDPHTLTAAVRSQDGAAVANARVRFTVTGANPGSGATQTGPSGDATITLTAANAGSDTVTVFVDSDDDGARDSGEPEDTARVDWEAAETGDVREFGGLSSGMGPTSITAGPDGALWFTGKGGRIGRMTTDGAVTEFDSGRGRAFSALVWLGDRLYITERGTGATGAAGSGAVLRFDPAGTGTFAVVVNLAAAAAPPGCSGSTLQPQGVTALGTSVWFTTAGCAAAGRIANPGGTAALTWATGIPSPTARDYRGIAPRGGALYIGVARTTGNGTYASITNPNAASPSVTAPETPLPSTSSTDRTFSVTSGPDGNVYFTGVNSLYRIDPANLANNLKMTGRATGADDGPQSITAGPDGRIWWVERATDRVGRQDVGGGAPEYFRNFGFSADPMGIAAGPDGNLWVAEQSDDEIGRVRVVP